MKIADKEWSYYWHIIMIPVLILVLWNVAAFVVAYYSYSTYKSIFSGYSGLVLALAMYAFVGWTTVKDHKGTVKNGAWAGAVTGVLVGLIAAIINLLMVSMVPMIVQEAVAAALKQGTAGINAARVQEFMMLGLYFGLLIGPLINGAIGALVGAIGALVGKKTK